MLSFTYLIVDRKFLSTLKEEEVAGRKCCESCEKFFVTFKQNKKSREFKVANVLKTKSCGNLKLRMF